ncbi:YqaA family protein [Thermoflexus sp.]|uniref:YqaA family protein n=1 Tax=Thermoflexus sp. TaxID=1969742 RepID=UPI0035E446F8
MEIQTKTVSKGRLWAARVAVVIILIGAVWFTLRYRDHFQEWARFGYPAIFLISALTNATLILPLPGLAVTTLAGGMFNPWIVGIVAGLGQAVGELSGYLVGYGGQTLAEDLPQYARLARWMRRYGPWVVFILALIPNPLFDVAGIIAGSTRMPVLAFLLPCALGKTLKNLIAAWAGFYGIELLQRWFGGL